MRPNGFSPLGRALSSSRSRLGPLSDLAGSIAPSKLSERMDFGDNPGALRMFTYTPPSLPEKAPLVVILHGCGQSAGDYARARAGLCLPMNWDLRCWRRNRPAPTT
jgi:poly(3-hydroxybutyrate) depolymerase